MPGENREKSKVSEGANWLPDLMSTTCMNCYRPFTLLRRRHHCRECGNLFCAGCTKMIVEVRHCVGCSVEKESRRTSSDSILLVSCLNRSRSVIGSEYEVIMHHGPSLECNICYELMQDGQQIALLNCYCQFHAECLEQ